MYASRRVLSIVAGIACCALVASCSSGDSQVQDAGVDGSVGRGGATGSGGTPGTGGTIGTGGTSSAGGVTGSGGATGSAGSGGKGGSATAGSSGGAQAGGNAGHLGGGAGAGGQTSGQAGASGTAGTAGGHAGSGGAGGKAGAAGHVGSGGQSGAGGMGGLGPAAPGGRISGYGTVLIWANANNQIVRLQTTMVVPPEPPASGTLFLWPGLQPDGANYDPINNGVLQPVLTWGPSCAPGKQPRAYSTWWISGQYVNTNGSDPGYTGCQGGPIMSVAVGDTLKMYFSLAGTIWTQTVTDVQTGQSVSYSIDMMKQAQNLAYFVIEEYSSAPVSEVIFTDTTITFGSPDSGDCKLAMRGQTDYVSVPVPSSDGRSCTIREIILRAQGIQ